MTSRSILQVFENYQKARLSFVQTIADLALRTQNVEVMKKANILDLLKPLINDVIPSIRQCASIALGRLVHNDLEIAMELVEIGLVPTLLQNATSGNKYQKTAVLFVLRSICKHNENMAELVIKNGGLQTFVFCLEDFEASVKESAAWGIGYISRHSRKLAQECVNNGILPLLMLCLQEPELNLKQIATSAICDIAKHCEDLAMCVVDAGIVPHLVKNLHNSDEKLKRQCLAALSAVARHSTELAEVVVEAEIFPAVLQHLSHPCHIVRRNSAAVIRDIAKQSQELTQLVVNSGGIAALLEIILQHPSREPEPQYDARLPCVTALGFIAGHSPQLAMTVIGCRTVQSLIGILNTSNDDSLLTGTAWAIGQIGKHSPEHAKAVASTNIFQRLVELYESPESSTDLKTKCQNALKLCLQNCLLVSALEPLLFQAPSEILKYVLGQYSKVAMLLPEWGKHVKNSENYFFEKFSISGLRFKPMFQSKANPLCSRRFPLVQWKIAVWRFLPLFFVSILLYLNHFTLIYVLPHDAKARRLFVTSGALKKIQQLEAKPGTTLMEYITVINSCFPEEIVRFYSPGYPETLLDKVEEYSPQMMTVLRETSQTNEIMQTEIIKAVVKDELSTESESAAEVAEQS